MDRHEKALELLHEGTFIPASPLALTESGSFDPKRQKFLTRYYLEAGAGGIAAAVHSTQFEIRDPKYDLLESVLSAVSEAVSDYEKDHNTVRVRVAGVCGKKKQAVIEARLAAKYGFDAVLVSPGGLAELTEDELLERAAAVAEVLPIIGFYLQIPVGGRHLSYDFWQRFCEIPNAVAIKCASFNRYSTIDVVRAVAYSTRSEDITLYTGNDDNIVFDLVTPFVFTKNGKLIEKRFRGGLLGHWSAWTHKAVLLFEQIKRGDYGMEILTTGAEVTDMNAAVFDAANNFAGCIPGVHEVLRRQGLLVTNACLDPNVRLSLGQAEEIERVSRMYPHLTDDDFAAAYIDKFSGMLK